MECALMSGRSFRIVPFAGSRGPSNTLWSTLAIAGSALSSALKPHHAGLSFDAFVAEELRSCPTLDVATVS
jgi:hypothetical protein